LQNRNLWAARSSDRLIQAPVDGRIGNQLHAIGIIGTGPRRYEPVPRGCSDLGLDQKPKCGFRAKLPTILMSPTIPE
jgi:hypothetical protein